MQDVIFSKLTKEISIPVNCGVQAPNVFLAGNALIKNGEIIFANDEGLIELEQDKYISARKSSDYSLPYIIQSEKNPQEIAQALLKNISECWGENIAMALMPLGHMVMAIFFELFKCKIGVPTLLLWGKSGSGKSTIIKVGLSIFGFDKDFLRAGNSTQKYNEHLTSTYNGLNICIDDLDPRFLNSSQFLSGSKRVFEAQARGKLKKDNNSHVGESRIGKSQLVYSTNKPVPAIEELRNRMSIYTIMKGMFDCSKFKYFDTDTENRKELSLILIELMKISNDEVLGYYDYFFKYFSENLDISESRIINNLAYDYTGAYIIQKIAGYEIEDFYLKVLEYAESIKVEYSEIPSPVDILLNSLVALKMNGQIFLNTHYKIVKVDDNKIELRFHKDTMLSTHNKYFSNSPEKIIRSNEFTEYLKKDERFIEKAVTVRYNGWEKEQKNSVRLDITNWEDLETFLEISYEDNRKGNTM